MCAGSTTGATGGQWLGCQQHMQGNAHLHEAHVRRWTAQPAPEGLAGRNTCSGTPTCIKHLCLAGPTIGAEGARWLQHVQGGADLDCANEGRPACEASHLKALLHNQTGASACPRRFSPVAAMDSGTRKSPLFKTVSKRWAACPPITNDQALAIASFHLFRFHLVFLFALSAQGRKGIPLMRVQQSVPAPRTPPSAHHKKGCDKTITKMARPTS